ncbi:Retrovirus-related Pol polyprotein from transposon TNT 1-94 [Gossypium australe]|uniref:Retrovirus-related Pol polyprotein from transposon TNT 1-94 n=1 Tax=Gossypium australe TaxID=47621 RepID=A0A5B6X0L7_9ROSI|nr:Retrovirus-related Pol polyprotein from transposon TNT 1-94 [Gossypium australe]
MSVPRPSLCMIPHRIQDIPTREILLWGYIRDGLYYFLSVTLASSIDDPFVHNTRLQTRNDDDDDVFVLRHYRLGHPSTSIVKIILDRCKFVSNKMCLDNVCIACQKGKSHKLPFSSSATEYKDFFIWLCPTYGDRRWLYAVIICIMFHSSTCVIIFLGFISFNKMVKTQFGKYIKSFQSDWGGEYHAFTSVLVNLGILHRLSCPHKSEQNGVAERKHRHIVETGLTLLAQAICP